MPKLTPRFIVIAFCILLFLLTAALSIHSGDTLRFLDEKEYHILADHLIHSEGYINLYGNPTAYRPPGYPFILSGVYLIWDRPLAGKLLNGLILCISAWLLASMAFHIERRSGIFVPVLILCYPILVFTASTLYSQTMSLFFLSAFLSLFISSPGNAVRTVFSGILYGVLLLITPSFILLLPVFILYRFYQNRSSTKQKLRLSALLLIGILAVISPWIIRNTVLFKKFVFISTNSGENLLYGNSENTTATSGPNADISHYEEGLKGMNEAERDSYFKNMAIVWIKQNPGKAIRLYLLKVVNYFNYRNDLGTGSESSRLRDLIMAVTYYPLLLLAAARLFFRKRFPLNKIEWLLYSLYFANAFLSAVFFTRIRFRLPFDALLIVIVSVFLGHLMIAWKDGKSSPSDLPAANG